MAPETSQKRKRLPFKPPSWQAPGGEASSSATPKMAKSKDSTRRKSGNSSALAKSKAGKKSTTSRETRAVSVSSESDLSVQEIPDGEVSGSESPDRLRSPSEEPDYILAEIVTNDRVRNIESGEPAIPEKLLTKLLHHHFQSEKTRIAQDANGVVAKYIDIFVREALARAAYEKTQGQGNADAGGGGRSVADGFLEVEDLEKLAPQLLMDF
ncbi:hypothetical protein VTN31DRAFT_1440 [Thermomyces dupontii]|uniref:uncharacterized protein n=1 Tax=Talaromyces thermophilus TaxID=28565 RepID=UPI0037428DDB